MDKRVLSCKARYEGTVWVSKNYGDFLIINYTSSSEVKIKFINTGFETTVRIGDIREGLVKDKLLPRLYDIGYIGEGTHKAKVKGKPTKAYMAWGSMLQRCYSDVFIKANPTYKGCSVSVEWHNFQRFAEWFEDNYIEGYSLDKDITVSGNKIYAPHLCVFVSPQVNAEKANAKHYKMLSPEGVVTFIYNMRKFCRQNDLNSSSMFKVLRGKCKQHRGWRNYEET